jgi:hypothetical protein
MVETIQCEDCGHTFDYDQEKKSVIKCPICKAEVHRMVVFVRDESNSRAYATGTMTQTNQQIIYEDASRLFRLGEYTVSVILAHTACEIGTIRTLHHAIQFNNLAKYSDLISKSSRSSHITSNEILRWYKVLTNDNTITAESFWMRLKESVKLRNHIIHDGDKATQEEAQEALNTVMQLFKHFGQLRKGFREAQNTPIQTIILEKEMNESSITDLT